METQNKIEEIKQTLNLLDNWFKAWEQAEKGEIQ